jgi:hypothetical protein
MLAFRSPEHGDSIVHMYPMQCILKNPDLGAVLDTGAQQSAAKYPAMDSTSGGAQSRKRK